MKDIVVRILKKVIPELNEEQILALLETPKDSSLGDLAFPCFNLAQKRKKNPAQIAQEIAQQVKPLPGISKIQSMGPYLNFFTDYASIVSKLMQNITKQGENYGSNKRGKSKKFMIEFSQPNTHKAFHVGHIRGTALGESIARVKEFSGYTVIRANYSGDTGMHIAKWIWAYQKFHQNEPIGSEESWFAKIYVEAVQKLESDLAGQEEVKEINRQLDAGKNKELVKLWKETRKRSIAAWKPIYEDLDVSFDVHFFESEAEKPGKKIAQTLVKKKIAERSEGATIMNFKEEGLGVFVLLRSDGTVLYSAKDLALAELKTKKYRFNESLIITSVEQNLHFQQLRKTLERMKFSRWKEYKHLGYESVRFPWGKMSSRTGDNVFYADFKEELFTEAKKEILKRDKLDSGESDERAQAIAIAAMKYSMLKQDINKVLIFNKDEAIRFEGDTGPYLLYSYARAQSILRKAKSSKKIAIPALSSPEQALISQLSRFPEVVVKAEESSEPALIAHYSYELAQQFNEFYHSCPVIGSVEESFRIALVSSFTQVIENALKLLAIPIIKQM